MSRWKRFRERIFLSLKDRHGTDELSLAILMTAIFCLLLSFVSIFSCLLSILLYGFCIFRMLSKNHVKRSEENRRYLEIKNKVKTSAGQALTRVLNARRYKYSRCRDCGTLVRLPRGVGSVNITCPNCGKQWKVKA